MTMLSTTKTNRIRAALPIHVPFSGLAFPPFARPSLLSNESAQEHDLSLFLQAVGIDLPAEDPDVPDGYMVSTLGPAAVPFFESRDGKAVLLWFRLDGVAYPLSIFFLKEKGEKALFCHSMLVLDSYSGNPEAVHRLRQAIQQFFTRNADDLLGCLEPTWRDADLAGQVDYRIAWNMQPTLKVATELFLKKLGRVPEIPLFPTVYSYNNPYAENLLEVALPEVRAGERVLVLGTGAGLDAACIALKHGVTVDATDVNPIAVSNTLCTAQRLEVDHLVRAWVSNGFEKISGKYDALLFVAPLASGTDVRDINRYDAGGRLLKRVLSGLQAHLSDHGRMYLMSHPDLSPYLSDRSLRSGVKRHFEAKRSLAIHEIRPAARASVEHIRSFRTEKMLIPATA